MRENYLALIPYRRKLMGLNLTPDELLSTTRSVRRRLDFDRPVEMSLIKECLELAIQAPSASNAQGWHFVVVTDPEKKARLAEVYRKAWDIYSRPFRNRIVTQEKALSEQTTGERVATSAAYLAENLHRAPVMLIPCMSGRTDDANTNSVRQASLYGSILPAVWSFMLAARARGLGSSFTTLHLMYEREAAAVLGIPYERVTQTALIPVAYTKGQNFKPAERKPLETVLHLESW
jgi:nitroreductase